jgi:hypothetical protein
MPDNFAFVDTDIFLHYRAFDEVDWLSVLGRKSVTLVVAPITTSELNNKKDEPTPKLRKRAASTLKKLEALWLKGNPAEVRQGVQLLLQEVEPTIDYGAHQLDYRSQDDRLLASIIQFANSNSGTTIMLVTADFGLRVKARRHGIETICPPDDLKLPEEPDPHEKKIQELERELLEIKHAKPQLEIAFGGADNRIEVSLEPPVISTPGEIERERKLTRLKYKKWGEEPKPIEDSLQSRLTRAFTQLPSLLPPSKESIDRFNAQMEKFYAEYDAWLAEKTSILNRQRRTVSLNLVLVNSGTSPAEDIDLLFHFPDAAFELYSERDLPRRPEPKPPEKPTSAIAEVLASTFPRSLTIPTHRFPDVRPRNVSPPQIRRTNSIEVKIHVRELKHNFVEELPPIYVVFNSHEEARSFGIEYQILAANLPKPALGQLHVIVRKAGAT